MTVIPTNYAQVNFIYTGAAVPTGAEWTLGLFVQAFSGTVADAGTAIDSIYGASGIEGILASNVNLSGILVKFGPDATGPSALEPSAQASSGGGAAAPNVSFLVHKNTALGGRAGRGRAFIPGVPESVVDQAGEIAGATVTAMNGGLADFFADLATADLPAYLLHGEDSPITTPTVITSFACDTVAATQRRRLRR